MYIPLPEYPDYPKSLYHFTVPLKAWTSHLSPTSQIPQLPVDIIDLILGQLSSCDLLRTLTVNKLWGEVSKEFLWKTISISSPEILAKVRSGILEDTTSTGAFRTIRSLAMLKCMTFDREGSSTDKAINAMPTLGLEELTLDIAQVDTETLKSERLAGLRYLEIGDQVGFYRTGFAMGWLGPDANIFAFHTTLTYLCIGIKGTCHQPKLYEDLFGIQTLVHLDLHMGILSNIIPPTPQESSGRKSALQILSLATRLKSIKIHGYLFAKEIEDLFKRLTSLESFTSLLTLEEHYADLPSLSQLKHLGFYLSDFQPQAIWCLKHRCKDMDQSERDDILGDHQKVLLAMAEVCFSEFEDVATLMASESFKRAKSLKRVELIAPVDWNWSPELIGIVREDLQGMEEDLDLVDFRDQCESLGYELSLATLLA